MSFYGVACFRVLRMRCLRFRDVQVYGFTEFLRSFYEVASFYCFCKLCVYAFVKSNNAKFTGLRSFYGVFMELSFLFMHRSNSARGVRGCSPNLDGFMFFFKFSIRSGRYCQDASRAQKLVSLASCDTWVCIANLLTLTAQSLARCSPGFAGVVQVPCLALWAI